MSRRVPRGAFRRTCERCGASKVYATERLADRHWPRHRCERTTTCPDCGGEKSSVAARCHACAVEARGIDRTPKPCKHKQANHQHGTYAMNALDGCRCEPCSAARSEYDQQRKRLKAYGRWDGWVDSEPLRAHGRALMAAGMGSKRIQALGGISSGTWTKLMYGVEGRPPSKRTRRDVAERLLAVQPTLADGRYVSSLGASRRVQALVALGWSQSKLAKSLGLLPSNFGKLAHGRGLITVKREREVRDLYDALSMTLPPETNQRERIAASRARNQAKQNGWLPPLAWDDEGLDDPTYRPEQTKHEARGYDHAAVERYLANGEKPGRKWSHDEAADIVRRLRLRGESTTAIERRGFKPERYPTQEGAAS